MEKSRDQTPTACDLWTYSSGEDEFLVIRVPLSDHRMSRLTAAERVIAERLRTGQTYRAIAEALRKSPRTVAVQASSIFRKLGVSSRSELVAALSIPSLTPEFP